MRFARASTGPAAYVLLLAGRDDAVELVDCKLSARGSAMSVALAREVPDRVATLASGPTRSTSVGTSL